MELNSKNAHKKLAAMQKNVVEAAHKGILDAGSFLRGKLVNEVLNSAGNAANGGHAPQPPHEPSKGRFVRRRTGVLVSAVKMRPEAGKVLISVNPSIAPYAERVNEWAKRKYGRGYLQIVLGTYKALVEKTFAAEIGRAIREADNGQTYIYENNYPPS